MLAAPFGEHRIVGTVAIDITRDNKSFGPHEKQIEDC